MIMEKLIKITRVIIIMTAFATLISSHCQKSEEETECEYNQWEEAKNYAVLPKVKVTDNIIPGHNFKDAVTADFTGSIRKYYCPDEPS